MGHKSNPKAYRLGVTYLWDSRWYAPKNSFPSLLKEDFDAREFLVDKLRDANVDSILIERTPREITFNIFAGKPGIIIGRGGKGIEDLQKEIEKKIFKGKKKVRIQVNEIRNPFLSASIIAQGIRNDIEKRIPFRRTMKHSIEKVMKAGALGVKIKLSGRLNGAEIARSEMLSHGKVPLQTLRSFVDYALDEAQTTYGKIGIKVWIYSGEIFGRVDKMQEIKTEKR